jgi:hypothetical protein
VAAGGPYVNHWHPWNGVAFELALQREDLDVRWFNPAAAWVWPRGAGPTTYYFPSDPLGEQTFDPLLEELSTLEPGSVPSATGSYTVLTLPSGDTAWKHVEGLERSAVALSPVEGRRREVALPVRFNDRFSLLGAEVADARVERGSELRVVTYWEVLGEDAGPVVSFVHLVSDVGEIAGQHDGLDVWPPSLQPGDRFAQIHRVPVRADAAPGTYHIEIGLYHPETLQRFPILVGEERIADRVSTGGQIEIED